MNNIYYQRPNRSQHSSNPQKRSASANTPTFENEAAVPAQVGIKEGVANIILILLSIVMAISLIVLVKEVFYIGRGYDYKEDSFWYSIEYGNYANLVHMRWDNEASRGTEKKMEQCYAAADYFEAASLYKTALHQNKSEEAKKYLTKMEESYNLLKDISYITEEMNDKLGIEDPFR